MSAPESLRGQAAAKAKAKAGGGGNALDLSDGAWAKDFSDRGQASLGNRGAKDFARPSGGGAARAVAAADTMSTEVAEIDLKSAAAVAVDQVSAVVVAAAAAEVAAAVGAPTSISSRTSSRLRGSTAVSNFIVFATRTATPRSMWASWRRTCRRSTPSSVWRAGDGYLRVDYDRIGVKFMTWKEWVARSGASSASSP